MALSKVSRSSNTAGKDKRDRLADQYGMSPWYGQGGVQMPNTGPPNIRGYQAPMYTPNAGDPRNAGYWKNEQTPEQQAAWQGQQDTQNTAQRAAFAADPAMSAARGAGDMRGYIAARQAMQQQGQQQRFIDQGGTAETWARRNDENAGWPVPGSPSGNYQYGPGRPGPTPPGVAGGGGGGGGGRGGLIEGYIPDAPSRTMASTGQGSAQPQGGMDPRLMQALQMQMGGYGQMSGGGGGQYGPMSQAMGQMQGQMGNMDGWAYPGPSQAMQTQSRGFPGGMQPTNPGPYGGRPVNGGYPTTPPPGFSGGRDFSQPSRFSPPQEWQGGGGYAPFNPGNFAMPYDTGGGMSAFYPQWR